MGSAAALLRGEQAAAMELPVMQLDTRRPGGAAGSTAALLRGEQAAVVELPVMQLDATRPWALWDRPLLFCEASRRRQ